MGEAPEARDEHTEHERHARPRLHLAQEQEQQQQQQQRVAPTAAFHIARPMNTISTIISTPPLQTSIDLEDPYQVSRILFQAEKSQQQQQPQRQQKLDSRLASGLEELVMSCTSAGIKGEASIPHTQETEWQYSYWSPDNPDHHG